MNSKLVTNTPPLSTTINIWENIELAFQIQNDIVSIVVTLTLVQIN